MIEFSLHVEYNPLFVVVLAAAIMFALWLLLRKP